MIVTWSHGHISACGQTAHTRALTRKCMLRFVPARREARLHLERSANLFTWSMSWTSVCRWKRYGSSLFIGSNTHTHTHTSMYLYASIHLYASINLSIYIHLYIDHRSNLLLTYWPLEAYHLKHTHTHTSIYISIYIHIYPYISIYI